MKLTIKQLKQLIKEQVEEGWSDKDFDKETDLRARASKGTTASPNMLLVDRLCEAYEDYQQDRHDEELEARYVMVRDLVISKMR